MDARTLSRAMRWSQQIHPALRLGSRDIVTARGLAVQMEPVRFRAL